MPAPEVRLKELLEETRLVMLGAQVSLGLQYQAAFRPGFARLDARLQWLDCLALLLILAAASLLLSTPSFHHIAAKGQATRAIQAFASRNLKWALIPLGLALGIDIAIALGSQASPVLGWAGGAAFALGSWLAWYVVPFSVARPGRDEPMPDKQQPLEARIGQALTELRVVLPGAQALFGFQFIAVLSASFRELPAASKAVHLVSTILVGFAIVFLIAPAAYHRIAAHGEAEERVLRYTVRMMLPAEGLIALAMNGDAYVTIRQISELPTLAAALASIGVVCIATLLYGVPVMARRGQRGR